MKDERDFVLLPSPEIDAFLSDNNTDLVEILGKEGIALEHRRGPDPAAPAGGREKDPVSIIVASAGAALALAPVLSRVLSALTHKTVLVTEMVLLPVEDSTGKVVRDPSGNPHLHWTKRARLLESQPQSPPKTSVSVQGPVGLKFEYGEK